MNTPNPTGEIRQNSDPKTLEIQRIADDLSLYADNIEKALVVAVHYGADADLLGQVFFWNETIREAVAELQSALTMEGRQ